MFFSALGLEPATDLDVALCTITITMWTTLIVYYTACGHSHSTQRQTLQEMLAASDAESRRLRRELRKLQRNEDAAKNAAKEKATQAEGEKKEIRVFVEGAFDLMHYGHANAFRQARAVGTYLIAGVNSSETIESAKGAPPVLTDEERCAVVGACKWVDEVIPKTPYVMTPEYLDWVIETYKIDYVIHGDDPCIGPDGKDVYADVKARGLFKSVPRTEGVSTTEIVGRMLLMTKKHHIRESIVAPGKAGTKPSMGMRVSVLTDEENSSAEDEEDEDNLEPHSPTRGSAARSRRAGRSARSRRQLSAATDPNPLRKSRFLTTSRMLRLFSGTNPVAPPQPGMKVVYVSGGWDMLHAGHVSILEKARAMGDYLLVGIYNDGVVNNYRGGSHPVLNLNERVLSVLANKHVSDIVIDPPYVVSKEMIAALNISLVVEGKSDEAKGSFRIEEAHRVPSEMGILRVVDSGTPFNMHSLLRRIKENQGRLEKKVKKKMAAEAEHYADKHGLEDYGAEIVA
jgi:ethanolamine-phosphate cytidylyltransferase